MLLTITLNAVTQIDTLQVLAGTEIIKGYCYDGRRSWIFFCHRKYHVFVWESLLIQISKHSTLGNWSRKDHSASKKNVKETRTCKSFIRLCSKRIDHCFWVLTTRQRERKRQSPISKGGYQCAQKLQMCHVLHFVWFSFGKFQGAGVQ
jgi:hypothetical protein